MPIYCRRGTQASFDFPGGISTTCSKCKLPGMIHLSSRECRDADCKISASFGFKKDRRYGVMSCVKHKLDGMVNITEKRCRSCEEHAAYNHPGIRGAIFCRKHKKHGMVHYSNYSKMKNREKGMKNSYQKPKFRHVDQVSIGPDGKLFVWKLKVKQN